LIKVDLGTYWCPYISIPQIHLEVYLSSTVDKIFTLDRATIGLHRRHLTLLHQHLLNRGSIQDLNPWIREVGGWKLGDADDEEKNQMEKQYWGR